MPYSRDERRSEQRYDVCWYLRAGHRTAGTISCRTVNVSVSGLLFLSQHPYDVGDMVELEIFTGPVTSVRCVVQIAREHPATAGYLGYGAEFVQMSEVSRHLLNDAILAVHRKRLKEEYEPMPWATAVTRKAVATAAR